MNMLPRFHLCVALLVALALLACKISLPQPPAEIPTPIEHQEPPAEEEQESEPTPLPEVGDSQPKQSVPAGMDLAPCPQPGTLLVLKFSATMVVEQPEAKLTHTLQDGTLTLMARGDDPASSTIESIVGEAIPYEIKGTMGPCAISGQGQMTPSAHGYCKGGIVYLIIIEDWGPGQGTMQCEDTAVPFDLPGAGPMTHTGADGLGEVFYLDRNFSSQGAGYTSIRPFQLGQGEHVWTLFLDTIPTILPTPSSKDK